MGAVPIDLAYRALVLAADPVGNEAAAAAKLVALAGHAADPPVALLAAIRLVGQRARASGGGGSLALAGRAARLLVFAIGRT